MDFVRAFAVFLQNFSVLVIIFSPKIYRIYSGEDTSASVRASVARGSNSRFTKSQASNTGSGFEHSSAELGRDSTQENSSHKIATKASNSEVPTLAESSELTKEKEQKKSGRRAALAG